MLSSEFSEAIDMWTLGCAMLEMISGYQQFSGETEYEIVSHLL